MRRSIFEKKIRDGDDAFTVCMLRNPPKLLLSPHKDRSKQYFPNLQMYTHINHIARKWRNSFKFHDPAMVENLHLLKNDPRYIWHFLRSVV